MAREEECAEHVWFGRNGEESIVWYRETRETTEKKENKKRKRTKHGNKRGL